MGENFNYDFRTPLQKQQDERKKNILQCSQISELRHLPTHQTAESCSQYHSMWVAPSRTYVSVSSRLELLHPRRDVQPCASK